MVDRAGDVLTDRDQAVHGITGPLESLPPRPQTPAQQYSTPDWNGLPSPQTPSCNNEAIEQYTTLRTSSSRHNNNDEPSYSCSSEKEQVQDADHFREARPINDVGLDRNAKNTRQGAQQSQDLLLLTERDAVLALELEALSSPTPARRSSRLRNISKVKGKPTLH